MKKSSDVPGVNNLKSIHSGGVRAIPDSHRSQYLDLFVLKREEERLLDEMENLNKRITTTQNRLDWIRKQIIENKELIEKNEKMNTTSKEAKSTILNY